MDISGSIASGISPQNPMMGVQIKLMKSAQDMQASTVATLLSSVTSVQPSVEPHLGNNINVKA